MEELMIVANVAIVFGVIYKLFELFAGRRERMMLIEKMGDKLTPETFKNGIMYRPSLYSFSSSGKQFKQFINHSKNNCHIGHNHQFFHFIRFLICYFAL
jgi:hypothetical protein